MCLENISNHANMDSFRNIWQVIQKNPNHDRMLFMSTVQIFGKGIKQAALRNLTPPLKGI